jgi:hypothetical protein
MQIIILLFHLKSLSRDRAIKIAKFPIYDNMNNNKRNGIFCS